MDIQGYMLSTVMIVCVAWVAGHVTEMDTYGAAVARLKNTANAQQPRSNHLVKHSNSIQE